VQCDVEVFLDEVGVDGNRCGRPGAGRRDDLGSWVDHVARGPHAGVAGAPAGIDGDEAGVVRVAPQRCDEPIVVGHVAGPDEHRRALHDASVREGDATQLIVLDHELRHEAVLDADAASVELAPFVVAEVVGVGEEDHIVGPLTHEQCVLHAAGNAAEHAERVVAHFPTVAVGAVEQILAPPVANAVDVRELVADAGRQQDSARRARVATGERDGEAGLDVEDPIVDDLDAVAGHLCAPHREQLGRGHAVS